MSGARAQKMAGRMTHPSTLKMGFVSTEQNKESICS